MRARAGDPPRTMPQKILAGRVDDPLLTTDLVRAKVDQVILTTNPMRTVREALAQGLKRTKVETAIVYDTHCVLQAGDTELPTIPRGVVDHGILIGRAGIGFPSSVHLERFAAPARLALTDDPRLAGLGGAGMLTLVASHRQLAKTLITGHATVRTLRSIQILLSGKLRAFSSVRDAGLELIRQGLGDAIARIDTQHGGPVVLEFAGPSARLLSVPERALLCSMAPMLGAAGAVFISDEKTEVFLRDQRRSKAHRGLLPDPGAPCDEVVTLDLGSVDPLVLDHRGRVLPIRDFEGQKVGQVILGGDHGASLKDILVASALLKSKRVPRDLDFLLATPSRQTLEVLAHCGALVDLIATGARLLEPDPRLLTGDLYPPPPDLLSLRSFDPVAGCAVPKNCLTASADTLAYAVASGKLGDPRKFKRPVRVTVPRALPTDDVLVARKKGTKAKAGDVPVSGVGKAFSVPPWAPEVELKLATTTRNSSASPHALLLATTQEVQAVVADASRRGNALRAVISPAVMGNAVPLLSSLGILALRCDVDQFEALKAAETIKVSLARESNQVAVHSGGQLLPLCWLATPGERSWTLGGELEPD